MSQNILKLNCGKKIRPFGMMICTWNGEKTYKREIREYHKQVRELISLQSGLGQSSQGEPEDYEWRNKLEKDVETLQISIKKALNIK
jgi:hypothetical protein